MIRNNSRYNSKDENNNIISISKLLLLRDVDMFLFNGISNRLINLTIIFIDHFVDELSSCRCHKVRLRLIG